MVSTVKGSNGKKEIPAGEVEPEDGGGLGAVAGQQDRLTVPPHVGVVRHVDILQAALSRQVTKVPYGDGWIWKPAEEHHY